MQNPINPNPKCLKKIWGKGGGKRDKDTKLSTPKEYAIHYVIKQVKFQLKSIDLGILLVKNPTK